MINHLKKDGYTGVVDELNFDMEFRAEVLQPIKDIIENTIEPASIEEKNFGQGLENLDSVFFDITIPTPKVVDDLPFWWNRVLKKGSRIYAEDVKLMYGIDIEIIDGKF